MTALPESDQHIVGLHEAEWLHGTFALHVESTDITVVHFWTKWVFEGIHTYHLGFGCTRQTTQKEFCCVISQALHDSFSSCHLGKSISLYNTCSYTCNKKSNTCSYIAAKDIIYWTLYCIDMFLDSTSTGLFTISFVLLHHVVYGIRLSMG